MTGGGLKRVRNFVADQTFCFTYGDGVLDVDINALLSHHKVSGRLATVTAVKPLVVMGLCNLALIPQFVVFRRNHMVT